MSEEIDVRGWSVPSWAVKGDLALFYATSNWPMRVANLRRVTVSNPDWIVDGRPASRRMRRDTERVLDKALVLHNEIGGSIFAAGYVVNDRYVSPTRDDAHFRDRMFADIGVLTRISPPLRYEEFSEHVALRRQATITHVDARFVRWFSKQYPAPEFIRPQEFGSAYVSEQVGDGWVEMVSSDRFRVLNEQHLRESFVDHLLASVATKVRRECACWGAGDRLGIADYVVEFGGTQVVVETKLRMSDPYGTLAQMQRYLKTERFKPSIGDERRLAFSSKVHARGLIIDFDGIYVTDESGFINCAPRQPSISRAEMRGIGPQGIRAALANALGLKS